MGGKCNQQAMIEQVKPRNLDHTKNLQMRQDVLVLTGAGQIGMAIARRMGHGKKILIADWKIENANRVATIMTAAGYDVIPIVGKHTGECFHDRLPADRALRMKW